MRIRATLSASAFLLVVLHGCGGGTDERPSPVQLSTDFNATATDWLYGYADYTSETAPNDVVVQPRPLPQPFTGYGLYTFGTNRSDDLFIYIKKRFSGFAPDTKYSLTFSVTFLTRVSMGCFGVGGPPGEGVVVKGGASTIEPMTVLVNNTYQMNIDTGNEGGKDALVLGNIANSSTDCMNLRYESKTLISRASVTTTSDNNGSLWILFGIDSGFEAASNIYYQSALVTASPVDS